MPPREHIENIRKRLSGGNAEREDRLLKIKPGHFIYELLQNADDTEYDADPIINFRYSDNRLLFECNEVGFTTANVEALCDANNSTKMKTNPTRRQIGEKGIGFKSVFKVCSCVWIKSGFYQFKFDKNVPLGRIRPTWDEFPVSVTEGYTGILIQLDSGNDVHIRNILEEVDPIILLFLQQVKHINISVHSEGFIARALGPTASTLTAETIPAVPRVLHRIRCKRGKSDSSLMVFRYPVVGLPPHELRRGRNDAEIILAFSEGLQGSNNSNLGGVYAYLPVGKYGLKFYVQSDFIVTASREKIDSNEWNLHLVHILPVAMIEAIKQFKDCGGSPLRYSWPLLLQFEKGELDIFNSLPGMLQATLSETAILEDFQGNLMPPSKLMHVPEEFMATNGTPLIPSEYCTRRPLNTRYLVGSDSVLNVLQRLGVETQEPPGFLRDLRNFMTEAPTRFRKMPVTWFNQLCDALMTLLKGHREEIADLDIVPLAGGNWVSPSAGYCYFITEQSNNLSFPTSIPNVYMIHPDVLKNPPHAGLLRAIGIKDGTPTDLCKHIVNEHAEYSRELTWSEPHQLLDKLKTLYCTKDLVSQMEFLYRSGWTPKKSKYYEAPDLWWTDEDGEFCRSRDIYIRSSERHSASSVSDKCKTRLHFLHPSYMKAFGNEPDGMEFLVKTVKLRKMLRLATTSDGFQYSMHKDFKSLSKEYPMRILHMLRETWRFYGPWFVQSGGNTHGDAPSLLDDSSKEELTKAIRDMVVPCHSGDWPIEVKLGEAYLPRKNLLGFCDANTLERCRRSTEQCIICHTLMPLQSKRGSQERRGAVPVDRLLDVSDPDEPSWNFLEDFGVITKLKASVFIKQLKQTRGRNASHAQMDTIYMHLENFVDGPDGGEILKTLKESASIYMPEYFGASRGTWKGLYSCVWDGPACLKRVPRLKAFYPKRNHLFAVKLGIGKANEKHLKMEAEQLRDSDDIEHVSSLLVNILPYLKTSAYDSPTEIVDFRQIWPSRIRHPFRSIRMIPVRLKGPTSNNFVLRSSDDDGSWFVPDRHHLRKAFLGLVDLAEVSLLDSVQLNKLIGGLQMEERCLSKVVTQKDFEAEQPELMEKYTASLRRKVPYIHSLENIRVIGCQQISNSWTLNSGKLVVDSHPDTTEVSCRSEQNALVIYMAGGNDMEEDLLSGPPPLEMSKGLLDYFRIEDKDDAALLTQILAHSSLKLLERDLERWPRRNNKRVRKKEPPQPERKNTVPDKAEQKEKTSSASTDMRTNKDTTTTREAKTNDTSSGQHTIKEALPTNKPTNQEKDLAESSQTIPKKATSVVGEGPGLFENQKSMAKTQEYPTSQASDDHVGEHAATIAKKFVNETESVSTADATQTVANFIPSGDYHHTGLSHKKYRKNAENRVHMNSGIVHITDSSPRMVFYGEDTKETQYLAELYISRYLEGFLGKDINGKNVYKPSEHWTSELRFRNHHAPFSPKSHDGGTIHSAFTIPETEGKLKALMDNENAIARISFAEACTFHIEVHATRGGLDAPFELPGQQYKKARQMTAIGKQGPIEHVYIIARIYNIHTRNPGFALYADPWKLYLEQVISLEVDGYFEGSVSTTTPAILSKDSLGEGFATDTHEIYKDLYVRDGKIRLLEINPGNDDEPIHGELIVKDLQDPETSFWAISYVWGSEPNDQSPMFKTSKGQIRITDSLNECLIYLRRKRVKALLWADAICIDQGNNIEKNMQVRRMGSLYDNAKKVVIWTGGKREEDLYAMDWLLTLRGLPRQSDSALDPATKISHINEFLSRAWFGRTWTVQELVFGSDVTIICGDQELGWNDFMAAIYQCEGELLKKGQKLRSSDPVVHLNKTRKLYKEESRRPNLLQLLEMFHYTKSSIPRDKLFAMLHMATDATGVEAFYPDYESKDEVILARYAKEYVASHEWLQLLYRAGSGKSSSFCTWIPDFMNSRRKEPYMSTISSWRVNGPGDGTHVFSAHPPGSRGVFVQEPSSDYGPPILAVKGYIFDSIGDCLPLETTQHSFKFSNLLGSLQRMANFGRHKDANLDWKEDLLVKCIIGDAIGPYHKNEQSSSNSEQIWPPELRTTICGIQLDQDAHKQMDEMSELSQELIKAYLQTAGSFLALIPDAALCVTDRGYIGIVPGATEPNDKVVLLFGSKVPFVLRQCGGHGQYKLIGECYVHSIMHFQASNLSGLVEEEIYLT
ncbi:heterokaryon incompatibility [Pyrenophora seminiperda CCB06]|uniref:Heterokaryon incompatibility n=1 Tax=Pyrenophora seminiperda CCB06 TaxID=1302712 RepID=A0A3M7MBX0_9PLEO|nr:heterokaryon incompatibility [Pyrenophora seminiperda CCB06]